jgi:RNA recognition motif-containing protein
MQEKKTYTRVFVGNIPYSFNEKKVKEHMSKAGEVASVELFLDEVGVSRGCGIIEYVNPSDCIRAIELLHLSKIEGRSITVKEDDSHSYVKRRSQNTFLKLRNLPQSVTSGQLRDLGLYFGNVVKAEVYLDVTGRSKGAGIVVYQKSEDAFNAYSKLNKAILNDRQIMAFIDSCSISWTDNERFSI